MAVVAALWWGVGIGLRFFLGRRSVLRVLGFVRRLVFWRGVLGLFRFVRWLVFWRGVLRTFRFVRWLVFWRGVLRTFRFVRWLVFWRGVLRGFRFVRWLVLWHAVLWQLRFGSWRSRGGWRLVVLGKLRLRRRRWGLRVAAVLGMIVGWGWRGQGLHRDIFGMLGLFWWRGLWPIRFLGFYRLGAGRIIIAIVVIHRRGDNVSGRYGR